MCGGGPTLFQTLGILYHLEISNFYKLENIETIYGTSAGAIIGVCIALKFDWETINDYLIKRPWQDVFSIKVQNILDAFTKKGIYDSKNIEKCFKPLFDAKDIPIDINLYDFYKITNVELHFFGFEINEYKLEDISYLTHPTISVMSAIQMTSAIPILMTPICINDKCYVDGGIACNYPLNYCIESGKQPDEILGFKNKYSDTKNNITGESNLLEFLMSFIYKAIFSLSTDNYQPIIANEVICDVSNLNFDFLKDATSNIKVRKELFESGLSCAKDFLSKITSNSNDNNEELDNSEKNKEIEIDIELENSIQELN
jgi:predicted acylesterase/phospholipase RssA